MVLFHGQAAVEGGFSINKDMLVENLTENSLVAQRVVYNAIQYYGGVLNVPLTGSLIESVKCSSRRRVLALEQKKSDDNKEAMKRKRVAELDIELNKIEAQRSILSEQQCHLDDRVTAIKKLKFSL